MTRRSKRQVRKRPIDYASSDSEATETGSEMEEADEYTSSRSRIRMLVAGRTEIVEDFASSDDEYEQEDCDDYHRNLPSLSISKRRRLSDSPCNSTAYTKSQSTTSAIDFTEPWWPQRRGSIQQRLSARDMDGCGAVGRSRRQMELWEFILRSLDAPPINGGAKSAFKWVNRSLGIFRVTNTQKAAKEWGLYRGNVRMDYEKMARAMR